jgi:hypothetical protein
MLRTDLSTRPFYNERAVILALGAAAVLVFVCTVLNVTALVALSRRESTVAAEAEQAERTARDLRQKAAAARRSVDQARLEAIAAAAHEANALIDRRVFSWTELFNQFEATLPPDVRLVQVQPQSDAQGRLMVALTVISRRIEDLDGFIGKLEATGTFRGVLSRSDEALEDGTIESNLQGYYQHEANPVPPSSEPRSAPAAGVGAEGGR